ncbi:MAG: hypothetical protein OXG98_09270 [Gemmatimonadetes bacterium]|nr:hypothetical protein [Gemmatimonadota bacterium]
MSTYVIISTFVVAIILVVFVFRKHVNSTASLVTVIGVLGTFCGIAWGLAHFNPANPDESIPELLDGLMFAFLTSICGIFASVVIKLTELYKMKKRTDSEESQPVVGATIDDLAATLVDILSAIQNGAKENRETLKSVEAALTGDGESTVLTQLQKLRTSFLDKQDEVIRAITAFSDQVAEDNTNALIEALESVMRDFNTKINEQFGDNFKHLNEAVGRVNDWQEQYRLQMNDLADVIAAAMESMDKSRQTLETITKQSDVFVATANHLEPVLQTLQEQLVSMNNQMEAFSTLSENARVAFPLIEERLEKLTTEFSEAALDTISRSQEDVRNQRRNLDRHASQFDELVQKTHEQFEKLINDTNTKLTAESERVFTESTRQIAQQISVLDKALEKALTESINSMGNQLASLSTKFVEDYGPLTSRLREVVRLADGLPSNTDSNPDS